MKRLILVLTALVAALPGLRAASLDSRVSAVTVYTDRAVVSRSATTQLTAGINELTFTNLPAGLLDQSLQVSATGSTAATILDVSAKQLFQAATPDPRAKGLVSQIQQLQQKDRSLVDRSNVLRGQSDLITRLQASAVALGTGEKSERPNLDEVKNVLTYGQGQLLEIATSIQTIEQQRTDLQEQINALQRQLGELRGPGNKSVKTVVVRVQAAEAGSLTLALNYTVHGASWTPGYDARVLTGEKAVQLGYFGNVRQNTGEDWSNVALTLSTAQPSLGGSAPDLGVWNLDVQEARQYAAQAKVFELTAGARADAYRNQAVATGMALEEHDANYTQATVDSAATSATFKIAVPTSIPSDGSVQKVPVTTVDLTAAMTYATTPKLRTAAFLSAKVINSSDYPLLRGAMNVFLDGTFVATSHLDTTMPGEKFALALGADEGISVKHQRIKKFAEEKGVFSKDNRLTYEYLITVQNNKRTAERVVVTDQVPVSRNEKIVVKVTSPAEKDLKPDAEGKLKWTLDLKPGEKRELTVKFTVDYPTDIQVDGLE